MEKEPRWGGRTSFFWGFRWGLDGRGGTDLLDDELSA